jgi:isoleucyl-tRNA synthetase/phosphoglycolate phosphatase-like HAD superfamily hydrolase
MSNMQNSNNFPPITPGKKFSEMETEILDFWKENQVFEKSVEKNPAEDEFVFFDGPPFATGTPHYGHILAGAIKDAIPRYMTMKGKRVNRKFGWDCHGVPVEFLIEKEHKIGGKPGIEKMGVGPFNDLCQSAVMRCADEWESTVDRMGRFVDFKNDYKTMDGEYMESVWSVFRELWNKGLIYEGEKVIPYSPKLGSPLSNFEANQNYKMIDDPAVTIKFKVSGKEDEYFLAWTTTPWTLPSNVAVGFGRDTEYSLVEQEDGKYWVASEAIERNFGEEATVVETKMGKEFLNAEYEPLFPFFLDENEKRFIALHDEGDYITTGAGTGIVHFAPSFGEEDANLCQKFKVFGVNPIDENGYFDETIADLKGKYFRKDEEVNGSDENNANDWVIEELKNAGKLFKREQIRHDYPFCWRTDCALMYRGIKTWFVDVQAVKKTMLEKNQDINWIPDHLRDGRFGKILETAPDWAISRNRYWGAPIPVWRCEECGHAEVVSTRAELEQKTGKKVDDIHKQFVDDLSWECEKCAGKMKRIPEVLDCWFESGAMPYASRGVHFQKNLPENNSTNPVIFFDFDGVLVDSDGKTLADLKALFEEKEMDFSDDIYAKIMQKGNFWDNLFSQYGLTKEDQNRYYEISQTTLHLSHIFPDTKNFLEKISDNFDLKIVSSNRSDVIAKILEKENLGKYFSDIWGCEYLGNKKEKFKAYFEKNPAPKTFFVTDTMNDLVEAENFDLTKVGVTWGDHNKEQLSSKNPNFVAESFEELEEFLMKKPVIFFDNDGVLRDSSEKTFRNLQKVSEEQGKEFTKQDFADLWKGNFWEEYFKKGYSIDDKKRFYEIGKTSQSDTESVFYDGAAEFIRKVSQKFDCKIISSSQTTNIKNRLQQLSLENCFSEVLGSDLPGNKNEKFQKFFQENPKENVFFVTDTIGDLVESNEFSQISQIGVTWGIHNKEDLNTENPDFVAESFEELESFLTENCPHPNPLPGGEGAIAQADFIAEGLDQTRGWFYTLHVLGCALTGKNIYKNVITNGIVLAEDGQKMSKSKKNYPDPNVVFDKYGADSMRFYMLSSPVVRAENFRFAERGVEEVLKNILLPIQNVYAFFSMYANIDGWYPDNNPHPNPLPEGEGVKLNPKTDLDKWILSEYEQLRAEFTEKFEQYKLDEALRNIPDFVDGLTNWFVRRSRNRFWEGNPGEISPEKNSGYQTLYFILKNLAKILAPVCPFFAEELWRNLTGNNPHPNPLPEGEGVVNSIHLQGLAENAREFLDTELSAQTKLLRDVIRLSAGIRARKKIKLRQPLQKLSFAVSGKISLSKESLKILQEEANVKEVEVLENLEGLAKQIVKPNARVIGKRFGKKTQEVIKAGKSGEFELLENGEVQICGEILREQDNEFEFGFECAEGIEGDGNRDAVVLLDTEISEDLMREGLAREIIRNIQDGRKKADFNISDRIGVKWFTESETLKKTYEQFGEKIDAETLTVERTFMDTDFGVPKEQYIECEVEGEKILFGLEVAK